VNALGPLFTVCCIATAVATVARQQTYLSNSLFYSMHCCTQHSTYGKSVQTHHYDSQLAQSTTEFHRGDHSAPPDPLVGFNGPYFRGRERKGREGEVGKGNEEGEGSGGPGGEGKKSRDGGEEKGKRKGEERGEREGREEGKERRVYCLGELQYWLQEHTVTTNGECHVIDATVLDFTIK